MWYILQTAIIIFFISYILNNPDVSHPASLGHIVLFAILMAWLFTWLISKFLDLLLTVGWLSLKIAVALGRILLIKPFRLIISGRSGSKQPRRLRRILP